MRDLENGLERNVMCNYDHKREVCELLAHGLCHVNKWTALPIKGTNKTLWVFQDTTTQELFKLIVEGDTLKDVKKKIGNKLISDRYKNYKVKMYMISSTIVFLDHHYSPKRLAINEYVNCHFDMGKIKKSLKPVFEEYVHGKIDEKRLLIGNERMIDVLVRELINDDEPMNMKQFASIIYGLIKRSNMDEILKKKSPSIKVKYSLLSLPKFSGSYRIYTDKYNDNTKNKTFDTITVELNMMSESVYNENLAYVKKNIGSVKLLLKYIIESDPLSQKYANCLKLFSLILTTDNVLVARFCFKEGLESKLN